MKKTNLISILLMVLAFGQNEQLSAQSQWKWTTGDSTINKPGKYGTQGTGHQANTPGSRTDAVKWTDGKGNLWLMGGEGLDASSTVGILNDLWRYNIAKNEWTWVWGDTVVDQTGRYGVKGSASKANRPGSRFGSVSWTDTLGNLWLMGGEGYDGSGLPGMLNDLWKYDVAQNEWTWESGDTLIEGSGVYGSRGISSLNNTPGARTESVSWVDKNGNLWLMGGDGFDKVGNDGEMNDLWKFDPAKKEWTWVSGDDVVNQNGNYGTKGTTVSTNKPGARRESVSWTDQSDNLWIFGGKGRDINAKNGALNDLWKFNINSLNWTWVSGDATMKQAGDYGTKGVGSKSNKPGARQGAVSWTDANGNLWLIGGDGYDGIGDNGYLNDVWKYDTTIDQWSWQMGDTMVSPAGEYGTKGVAGIYNIPGGRDGAIAWLDGSDNLWVFGGQGLDGNGDDDFLNDLWKLGVCPQSSGTTLTKTACDTFRLNGIAYTTSGKYFQNFTNAAGCDSVVTLNLTITKSTTDTIVRSACTNFTLNSQTYTTSGTYTQNLTNTAGCDSTLILVLTISDSLFNVMNVKSCDSFDLNGQQYLTSGTYHQYLKAVSGCDSVIILNLSLGKSSTGSVTASACDRYNLNGEAYTASGTYNQKLTNYNGCDSFLTLHLTIYESPKADFSYTDVCDSTNTHFTWSGTLPVGYNTTFLWDFNGEGTSGSQNPGFAFSTSGVKVITLNLTSSNGCKDSIAKNLAVGVKVQSRFEVNDVCEGERAVMKNKSLPSSGGLNYEWRFGDGYTSFEKEPQHLYPVSGSSKTFMVTLVAKFPGGCSDSVTHPVNVNSKPNAGFSYVISGKTVTFSQITKGAENVYTWKFGDGNFSADTNPVHQYSANKGSYEVCLKIKNAADCESENCKTISIDVLGTRPESKQPTFSVSPNPSNGTLNIVLEPNQKNASVTVFNLLGASVCKMLPESNAENLALNMGHLAEGVYLVQVSYPGKTVTRKIVIKH